MVALRPTGLSAAFTAANRNHQPPARLPAMTTATKPVGHDYTALEVKAYSDLLEDCTGYTVQVVTDDEGEHCYQLTDACGDAEGEPWYEWVDVVADTLDTIEAQLVTERGA